LIIAFNERGWSKRAVNRKNKNLKAREAKNFQTPRREGLL
jgi:hypothetical protein